MKFTYSWLKDFVEVKLPAEKLAEKLTMAGLEVTALEEKSGDWVFEVEITSNRPDWLSVAGIAREVAAILGHRSLVIGSRSKRKNLPPTTYHLSPLSISIENRHDCPLYTAKIIRNVKVAPSPVWLSKRLELIGCRSVNNIVDITNYCLFTWGEPLHAFDLDKLVNPLASYPVSPLRIIVRRAKEKEEIITIDGIKRILDSDNLIIAGGNNNQTGKPIAIAGIMGGKDTEVGYASKNILLEAAVFNALLIRRGRQKLGMQTDSSYRFERGIDAATAESAAWQAASLIEKIAAGECVLAKAAGGSEKKKKTINLETASVSKILGAAIPPAEIRGSLTHLGFGVRPAGKKNWRVEIPSFRQDVQIGVDLIEEIARIYGYEKIPQTRPKVAPQTAQEAERDIVSKLKNMLVGMGLKEVITSSLIDGDLLKGFQGPQGISLLEIANPLSKEQEDLRPTLLPGLVKCAGFNLNQKQDYINIFEIGKVFFRAGSLAKEELVLGLALCGRSSDPAGLLDLKGIIETVFTRLGVENYSFRRELAERAGIYIAEKRIGMMQKLPPEILGRFEVKNKSVVLLELALGHLLQAADLKKKFQPLPLYPGIIRDISLVIKEGIPAGEVLKAIRNEAGALLEDVKVADYYRGKQIPSGAKALLVTCVYRSLARTLTEAEVEPLHSVVIAALKEKFTAQIR